MKKVLISGASVAGPTIAYWLNRFNYQVTVVERENSLRLGGQNIDIKGAAKTVAEKMGVYQQIEDAGTGEIGTHYVDEQDQVTAVFEKGALGGLTSELEVLRGDLVDIFYKLTHSAVNYVFGDYIAGINDKTNYVEVTFHSGKTESYDLVVVAEGQQSQTRELIFGQQAELKYLGLYTAYFTIPEIESDSKWAKWYVATKSRSIIMRPDNKGTTRIAMNFLSEEDKYRHLDGAQKKKLLRSIFEDAGWQSERILNGMETAEDIYLDSLTQVKMPQWSKGRVVLLGDAAYCPTPLTGKGTALAMIGAYVLAHELKQSDDHSAAFSAYENKLRAYVESVQDFPASFIKLAYPSSQFGVYLVNKIESALSSKIFQSVAKIFNPGKSDEDDFVLPEYNHQDA